MMRAMRMTRAVMAFRMMPGFDMVPFCMAHMLCRALKVDVTVVSGVRMASQAGSAALRLCE